MNEDELINSFKENPESTVLKFTQSVVEEIQKKLNNQVKLPSGYYFTYGGQFENLQEASNRLLIAVPVSLLLIFVLLYFTFSSFKETHCFFSRISW